MNLDKAFWTSKYEDNSTGWDLGMPSPPLIEFVENSIPKDFKILIPGAGNAWEAEYLFNAGWKNIDVVDLSHLALQNLSERIPAFPKEQLFESDFFQLKGQYDLILEQTFFCALNPKLRPDYVSHMSALLKENGLLAGVLFKVPLFDDHPPFGGSSDEYEKLFEPYFSFDIWEDCRNSVDPRAGNELFIKLKKKP